MARTETSKQHTPQSFEHLASELEDHATALRSAATMLSLSKSPAVEVKYESSRVTGFENLRTWVAEARQAVYDARLHEVNSVRKAGHSDESGPKSRKSS